MSDGCNGRCEPDVGAGRSRATADEKVQPPPPSGKAKPPRYAHHAATDDFLRLADPVVAVAGLFLGASLIRVVCGRWSQTCEQVSRGLTLAYVCLLVYIAGRVRLILRAHNIQFSDLRFTTAIELTREIVARSMVHTGPIKALIIAVLSSRVLQRSLTSLVALLTEAAGVMAGEPWSNGNSRSSRSDFASRQRMVASRDLRLKNGTDNVVALPKLELHSITSREKLSPMEVSPVNSARVDSDAKESCLPCCGPRS